MAMMTPSEVSAQSLHGTDYWSSFGLSWWGPTEISSTLYTVLTTLSAAYYETYYMDTTVSCVYSSDGVGGGTVRKFTKRWWTVVSSNTTNGMTTGVWVPAILSAGSLYAYNSDATNFPAGTANASRCLWAVNTTDNTVELRLYGSTSPGAVSIVNSLYADKQIWAMS